MMIVKKNRNTSGWSLETGYINVSDEENYPFQASHKIGVNTLAMTLSTVRRDIE